MGVQQAALDDSRSGNSATASPSEQASHGFTALLAPPLDDWWKTWAAEDGENELEGGRATRWDHHAIMS